MVNSTEQKGDAQEELDIKFEGLDAGSGKTKEGVRFSFQLFRSSDGVGLSMTIEDHVSPEQANRELQRIVKKAEKVIKLGPKINGNGEQVGERAVLLFSPNEPSRARAELFWTDGRYLKNISSPSLQHVLKFEKSFYR
jgi:hypothetical protein